MEQVRATVQRLDNEGVDSYFIVQHSDVLLWRLVADEEFTPLILEIGEETKAFIEQEVEDVKTPNKAR